MHVSSVVKAGFRYDVELLRPPRWMPPHARKDPRLRRMFDLVDRDTCFNIIPTEGLNHILSVICNAGSQVTTWYIGLFEGNYTPIAANVMSTFPTLSTECTAYDETTREEFVEAAPSAGSITNSANKAEFTMNASKTLYGAFISSSSVKAGTSGTLLSAARFGSSKAVEDDDVVRVTATLTLTSS